jgi:hypothetical protein
LTSGFTPEGVDVAVGASFFYVNGMCSSRLAGIRHQPAGVRQYGELDMIKSRHDPDAE